MELTNDARNMRAVHCLYIAKFQVTVIYGWLVVLDIKYVWFFKY